ncbi:hypothetical protein BDK92_1468 [Micromonospora pisi]|uniref:Cell division protein FtsB n=1 Tax=Micromonospora pisi TaxID=589240 RepID=A0A495JE54_9ACTN|nr:hypothetical protein [Micromonospora pisi]RKR87195.1 hypothetical protein BDK92_1468 [Micromonospora pisi]
MNVNKRDHRDQTGVEPRTPRSGGRTAAERSTTERINRARTATRQAPVSEARARGAREFSARSSFPIQGSAALRAPELAEVGTRDRAARESARAAHPAGGERSGQASRAGATAREAHPAGSGRVDPPALRVAPPLPVSVPRAPFVGLILAMVVGGVLGVLVINTKINENAIRLDKLQKQQATLDLQQQELKREIDEAQAPGNLVAEARKLGLVDSGPPAFIRLPDGRLIGVPKPAGGQPSITSQQNAGG